MAIKVSVFGAEKESDEYNAALKLKNIIQTTTLNLRLCVMK